MTDQYVNGPRNAGQKYDNLLLTRNRKPQSRPGSLIFDDSSVDVQQIPPGAQRIQHLANHESVLFEYSADEIYFRNSGVFSELLGPVDSNDAFGDIGTVDSRNSTSSWQGHLYSSIDTYSRPRKIYADEAGVQQIRTMGLPSPGEVRGFETAVTLANALKATYNTHVNDLGGGGSDHISADTNVTAADATDLDSLVLLANQIKDLYIAHNKDSDLGIPVFHVGTASSGVLTRTVDSADDIVTLTQAINLLNDLKQKYNAHDADASAHTVGSSHPEATVDATKDFTITPTAGANSYIYGINYKFTYKIGTVFYIDRGPIHQVAVASATSPITLSDIPNLANDTFGTKEAWDTVSIVIEITRTENNGIILKRVAEIENSLTSYVDTTADADLGLNAYTTGGVVNFDPAPECKYLVETDDVVWFANVKEQSEEKPFRIRQSIPLAPDAAPTSFTVDLDAEIKGISAIGIFPVVFTEDKTFRLEGKVDAQGRGFVRKRIIDDTVGCVSNDSIVQVKEGLYFFAKDGIYFTDGFKATKVTNHLNASYNPLTATAANRSRIYGAYNPITERVYWSVTSSETATENDEIWVLDPHWGFPNGQGTFTTWSYGVNGSPTALEVIDGDLIRSDLRGYTFRHTDDADNVDPVVDTGENPEDWETKQVVWDYISSAFTFGSEFQRKWVTRLLTTLKSTTNTSVQPQSINDDTGATADLKEIRLRTIFEWGDPTFTWGDPDFIWNAPATSSVVRRFPKQNLRCTYKQVRYTNAETILAKSDDLGTITVDSATPNATLNASTFVNTDLVGFELKIGADSFPITAATSTVLTLQDPQSRLVDGVEGTWTIVGFRKDEQFNLEAYTVLYDFFGDSHRGYHTGDDGGNA